MRRVRLRTLLIVLILVTTLPVAAFAAWVIWRSTAHQAALIGAQNIEQARAVLVAVDLEIEATIAALNVLALLDPIDDPDKTLFSQIAARVMPLHPGWQLIRLVDPSLKLLSSTSGPVSDVPLLDSEWVLEVIRSGRPAVSSVRLDPASGHWVLSVGVPVRRDGQLKYVLGARLYARMFGDILRRQKAPVDGVVTLLDKSSTIVARTRNEDRYVGSRPTADFVQRSQAQTEGSWRAVLLEGTAAYSAWSRSPRTGWTVGIGLPAAPIDGPVRRSFVMLVTGGLALTAGGLILAMFLGRRLIRAQTAATAAAAAVARGESMTSFDSRIAEAHDLAEGLREAAAILDTRLRERDRAQAEADRTRAALLEQETQARQEAEALSRAKDEFIATVSHELRTPLNAIFGWVAMLRTGTLDAERQAHAFDIIDRNTRAQAQLIEDILDMSRAIQGNIRLVMEQVDLPLVLESAIESLRPTAEARRQTIHVQPGSPAIVIGDPRRLQQVLWNILSNAMKFTGPGGRIDVSLETEEANAVVRISDSGEGITPEFLPHVFERFRQENPAVTRTHSGLGLGLSLARHIVELHGGTIAAASDGKGRGAAFIVSLPLVLAVGSTGVAPASSTAHAVTDIYRLRGRRVLVVDGDGDARDLAAEALGQAGALVVTAATPAKAMAAIDVRVPDVVVATIDGPSAVDDDFAHRLRQAPRTATVPLLALTADDGVEAIEAALAAGFHACLRKPYEPAALAARVAGLLVTPTK